MVRRYKNIQKIPKKTQQEVDYEFGLIKKQQEEYFQKNYNDDSPIKTVLEGMDPNDLITIINDASIINNSFIQNAIDSFLDVSIENSAYDIVDLFVLLNVINVESQIITDMNKIIYSTKDDAEIKGKISSLLIELSSYIDACSTAAKVDENHSYTWKKYVSSQLFTFKLVKERVKELVKKRDAFKNTYNGEKIGIKGVDGTYSGNEMIAAESLREEKISEAEEKERKYGKKDVDLNDLRKDEDLI